MRKQAGVEQPKNPVAYAEQKLGVHRVHDEALVLVDELESARREMADRSGLLRSLREHLADRETELVIDERGLNPTMSATAFEKYIKQVLQQDADARSLRQRIIDAQHEHDLTEVQVKVLDRKLDVATARLTELGGLLAFYGAVTATRTNKSHS